ncbi:hypothetical protein BH20ACI3_BH20ACI3_00900 [soil metagenome]
MGPPRVGWEDVSITRSPVAITNVLAAAFFHLAGLCQLGQTDSMEVFQLEAEIAQRLRACS